MKIFLAERIKEELVQRRRYSLSSAQCPLLADCKDSYRRWRLFGEKIAERFFVYLSEGFKLNQIDPALSGFKFGDIRLSPS